MSPRHVDAERDPIRPRFAPPVAIEVDGERVEGVEGQTIAGVLLGADRLAWRESAREGAPRGLFCGIGVCFDCLVEVNGARDVRACQRRARSGDVVRVQRDRGANPTQVLGEDAREARPADDAEGGAR